MKRIFLLSMVVFCSQWVNAESLQISPDEADRFNSQKQQQVIDAANTAVNQPSENASMEELGSHKRGTGELFETTIQQQIIRIPQR